MNRTVPLEAPELPDLLAMNRRRSFRNCMYPMKQREMGSDMS